MNQRMPITKRREKPRRKRPWLTSSSGRSFLSPHGRKAPGASYGRGARRGKKRRVLDREKLYGKAKEARRREIFERSGGRCEQTFRTHETEVISAVMGYAVVTRCNRHITWEKYDPDSNPNGMEWSHNRHAANKCDCLACGIASCHECHQRRHNPKSCPSKRPTKQGAA
jgi:hypothetical protein